MVVLPVTLAEVKVYLRIDDDVEDDMINGFINTADVYLRGAVDNYDTNLANADFKQMAKTVSLAIITELYDNRGAAERLDYSYTVRTLIAQMQYWSDVSG